VESRELRSTVYSDEYNVFPSVETHFSFDSVPDDGIYFGVEQTYNGAVASLNYVETGPQSGRLDVRLIPPQGLRPGTYTDTVTLNACYDEGCRRPLNGSPATIAVIYEILAPPVPPTISYDKTSLSAVVGMAEGARTLSILATLDGVRAPSTVLKSNFRPGRTELSGIDRVEVVRLSDTQRRVDVHLADPNVLGPQNFMSFFTLSACYDDACSRRVEGTFDTSIWVAYEIREFVQQAVQQVANEANDMVWSAAMQRIYLSFPSSAGAYANRIAALDPITGEITASAVAGSEPERLAVSDDGAYLYVASGAASQVRRFKLPEMVLDATLDLGPPREGYIGPRFADSISVAPGQALTLAVTFTDGGLAVYDDIVRRPNVIVGDDYYLSSMVWGQDASVIYGCSAYDLHVFDVTDAGVLKRRSYSNAFGDYYGSIHHSEGLVYSDVGPVVNPDTGSQLGTFRLGNSDLEAVFPEATTGHVYTVSQHSNDPYRTRRLTTFDAVSFAPMRTVQIDLKQGDARRLIRWGSDGLGLLTTTGDVYLLSGAARTE
jgi:hypothetical protein